MARRSPRATPSEAPPARTVPWRQRGIPGVPQSYDQIRREIWEDNPPDTPYPCENTREGTRVGQVVPGRLGRAGPITGCATPGPKAGPWDPVTGHRHLAKRAQGQWWFGFLQRGLGRAVGKATVARAFREATMPWCDRTTEGYAAAAQWEGLTKAGDEARATGTYYPNPTDYEFPHKAGRGACCAHAKKWEAWRAKVESELVPWQSDQEVAAILRTEPEWPELEGVEKKCLMQWGARVLAKREPAHVRERKRAVEDIRREMEQGEGFDPRLFEERVAMIGEGWQELKGEKARKKARKKAA